MNFGLALAGIWLILLFVLHTAGLTLQVGPVRVDHVLAAVAGGWLIVRGGYLAYRLLGVWLLLTGLVPLLALSFAYQGIVMGVLAVAVAVLLFASGQPRVQKTWGARLLGVWLLIQGLMALLSFGFAYSGIVLATLGLIAGILLTMRK